MKKPYLLLFFAFTSSLFGVISSKKEKKTSSYKSKKKVVSTPAVELFKQFIENVQNNHFIENEPDCPIAQSNAIDLSKASITELLPDKNQLFFIDIPQILPNILKKGSGRPCRKILTPKQFKNG